MNTRTLAKKCLTGRKEITARAVANVVDQPFAVWCQEFAPDKADEIGAYEKLLFELGQKHEQNVIQTTYPDVEVVKFTTQEEGFELALNEMAKGVKSLSNTPLFFLPDGLYGVADVIERVDEGKSIFGRYHYAPTEIKLAKNITAKHLLQTAFYCRLLGKIQNYTPPVFRVVNGESQIIEYEFEPFEDTLTSAIQLLRDIRSGKIKPTPTFNGSGWPWETFTNAEAIRTKDMSLICSLGPSKKAQLETLGLRTVEDIFKCPDATLLGVKGIAGKTLQTIKTSAQALQTGKPIILDANPAPFPKVKSELFLDLEGTMKTTTGPADLDLDVDMIDYLIGILERENGKERFVPFIAHRFKDEGKMWKEFLKYLAKKKDFRLYHWSHYEKTHFNTMKERHGCPPKLWAKIETSLVDLLPIAKKTVMFPTYGYSIKKVAPYCGFHWRQNDVGATESIAMYVAYTETKDKAIMDKILKYNEDDVIATRVVKDWLDNPPNQATAA